MLWQAAIRRAVPLLLVLAVSVRAATSPRAVHVVTLHGEVDRAMAVFVRRSLARAEKEQAATIVFDIDTFGGRVDSALQIAAAIGSARAETIAYVTAGPSAKGVSWSAGALIAFSCRRIMMAPGTTIGAAAPVTETPEGMQAAPEKVVSAVRAQMAALAEKNGYPKAIAIAMVDQDVELWEAHENGRIVVATSDDYAELERRARIEGRTIEKGSLVSPKGKLLTLTAGEMERYGVSSGTVPTLEALLAAIGSPNAEFVRVEPTTSDQAVALLTGTVMSTLLIVVGLIALFIEATTPGFGVPGTVAIACFATVFAGNALLGTVGSLEILLFIAGLLLLVVEIFVLPGFGIVGVSGILLMIASLVLSRQDFVLPRFAWEWDLLGRNLVLVLGAVAIAFVGFVAAARFLPRSRPLRGFVLSTAQRAEEGFTVQGPDEAGALMGRQGVAVTPLRPVGKAELDGEIVVVETRGEFLEKGSPVQVIEVAGNRIVVRKPYSPEAERIAGARDV